MKSDEVLIRTLTADDLPSLGAFHCSAGTPWEDFQLAARSYSCPKDEKSHWES